MSQRLCDAAALGFALWTLACHTAVALGADLRQLIAAYTIAAAALVIAWRRFPARSSYRTAASEPQAYSSRWVRIAAAAIAIGAALTLDPQSHPIALWWLTVAVLATAAAMFVIREPATETTSTGSGGEPTQTSAIAAALAGLCAICVSATLLIHRPDLDDSFYVNVAVAAADAPAAALLAADTLVGVDGLPLHMPAHRLHSWELWNGAWSYLTSAPAIYVFHWGSAALVALLIPLAHARLFRLLAPRHWIWAVAALVVVLLASGETHRSFGNFAFARAWQGKAPFLFVFMPLVYAYGIAFARRPSVRGWLLLAAAQIAAVGCSSTAVWAAPAGAWMALATVLRPTPRELRVFALGALASVYGLGAGWLLKGAMSPLVGDEIAHYALGARFDSALTHVFGTSHLLAFAVACVIGGWACQPAGLARRFAIVFPLAVWLVLLNPYLDAWIAGNVTGPAHWRAMWSLPVPILMALVLAAPVQITWPRAPRWTGPVLAVVATAAFAIAIPRFATFSPDNGGAGGVGIRTGAPGLKVPRRAYGWAQALTEIAAPGAVVLASPDVGVWLPTFHERVHPLQSRRMYLERQRPVLGADDVNERLLATRYAGGANEWSDPRVAFRRAIERFDVAAVCLRKSAYSEESGEVLRGLGFERVRNGRRYEIWSRTDRAR